MNRRTLHLLLKSLRSMLLIALPAIHRFCTVWFERYFTFFPTICTSRLMHFSWCAAKTTASVFSIHSFYFLCCALVLTMLYLNIYLHHSEEKTSDMPVLFKNKNHIIDASKIHPKRNLLSMTAPGGFEPPTLAPKAKMLPLHHGARCSYQESLILFKRMHQL